MKIWTLALVLAATMGIGPIVSEAAVANFSFTGKDIHPLSEATDFFPSLNSNRYRYTGYLDSGIISFTYNEGPGTLVLSDLTSFSVSRAVELVQLRIYETAPASNTKTVFTSYQYTQSLGQLLNFSAIVSADGTVTALSLETSTATGSADYPNGVFVNLGSSDYTYSASTTASQNYPDGLFTTGSIVQVVPEPAALAAMPVAAAAMLRRRRA